MADLPITYALIFSERKNILNPLKVELKNIGLNASHVDNPKTVKEYITKMKGQESAFLILDWDAGADKVLQILGANRGEHHAESHPVFLLAAQLDDNVVAVASEYHCAYVHIGDVSQSNLRETLKRMIDETRDISPIKQLLIKVEKSRANGELAIAANLLNQIAVKAPSNKRVQADLADCYLAMGELAKARQILEPMTREQPVNYARAFHLLARCYLKEGKVESAIENLKKAQEVSPYSIERLSEMGNIYLNTNRPAQAKAAFNELLALAPENKTGKMGKGTSMMLLGEVNEALNLLRESASPQELASVFNTAAIINIRRAKHEDGMNLYRTAMTALDGKSKVMARIMFNMGIGYAKWDKADQSMRCFQKACDLDPEFQDAQYNVQIMGVVLKKKEAAQATKAVQQASKDGKVVPLRPANAPALDKDQDRPLPVAMPQAAGAELIDMTSLAEGVSTSTNFSVTGDLDFSVDFDENFDDD